MNVYLFCLCLGFIGLLAIAFLGHFHGFGHHAPAHSPSAGHVNAHGGHHVAVKLHAHASHGGTRVNPWIWLSPRVLFSLVFAFGATGMLLANVLPALLVMIAAIIGAVIFERWMVQPLWRILFGFASNPARTLDHALLEEAEAVTNFNRRGEGLVAVNLDGQRMQLLGTLSPQDLTAGVRVATGDHLSIIAVNTRKNSCTVSRIPAAAPFSQQPA